MFGSVLVCARLRFACVGVLWFVCGCCELLMVCWCDCCLLGVLRACLFWFNLVCVGLCLVCVGSCWFGLACFSLRWRVLLCVCVVLVCGECVGAWLIVLL